MSAPAGNSTERSWLSNGSYPAQDDRDANAADLSHRPDVPTPEERVSGIVERYGDRVFEPLSETHGRKLREECLTEPETVERRVETGDHTERVVSETVERGAIPWIGAVAEMLDWYEGYRDRSLRLGRGSEVRGDHESFLVDMDNSLTPAYQSKQYARLNGMKRQFIGGEYPNGETVEGAFSDPVTVLFGLTSSSLRSDGSHRPVVDHDREIRESWKGSSGSVKRTLRYVLEDSLGLETGEYAWWWQSEPHPGPEKAATAYSHSHPVVVFDGAAVSGDCDPTDPETYRPVVAKHVAECEGAGWEAHSLDKAVSVREADDIEDFASYVAEYLSVAPDDDLLERSDEYLMWAASQWATTTQKYSRSKWATAAVKADACEQEAMDPEAEQSRRHGEAVVRAADKVPHRYECAECGSPHGIDQSAESLARHRLDATASASASAVAATDGGEVVGEGSGGESGRALPERWSSARSAGSVGSEVVDRPAGREGSGTAIESREVSLGGGYSYCSACGEKEPTGACEATAYQSTEYEGSCLLPPEHFGEHTVVEKSGENASETCTVPSESYRGDGWVPFVFESEPDPETVSEGFDRPPVWKPEAVVQTASGEETEIGSPGGTAYGEIVVEGAESITGRSPLPYLPPPSALEGPEPWEGTDLFDESDVRLGLVPPPEMVAREMAESVQSGRRVTPKEWRSDWYAARFGRESGGDCERQLPSGVSRSIEELVRTEGVRSVPSVMGRLGIGPSLRDEVESVILHTTAETSA